eukprot:SAG11_NODE_3395_length_2473_cov_1.835720_4_plen_85_part_00
MTVTMHRLPAAGARGASESLASSASSTLSRDMLAALLRNSRAVTLFASCGPYSLYNSRGGESAQCTYNDGCSSFCRLLVDTVML